MPPTLATPNDAGLRAMSAKYIPPAIPVLLAILGAVVANIPITFIGGWMPPPMFALMPLYFWCLVRPDLVPPAWVLVVGVLQDLFSGGPPGMWSLAFVVTYVLIDRQRETYAGLSGSGAILGFATAALLATLTAYITFAVYYWKLLPLQAFVIQFAVTVVFYVPVAMLLGFIHRRLIGPLRSEV
ncbi:MAG: hypothetical protein WCD42_08200 [Rhizomicrobium sp.]